MQKKTVLSGIRATGRLHLGNYLGAVKGMLELQANPEYQTFYTVADLHAITTPYDKADLAENTRSVVMDYVAAGLDPDKSTLFIQSLVPEHTELAYLFSSAITIARMQHLPTFKEKVKQHPDNVTMALLNYPVLMAADILIYKAGLVPVGIDQEPHLEIAREIAGKVNFMYGLDFPEPQRFATKGEYVPSLLGQGKMSKSVEGSYINLTDSLDEIKAKLAKVPTDVGRSFLATESLHKKLTEPQPRPAFPLVEFVDLFMGDDKVEEYLQKYMSSEGIRYGELKNELAVAIYKELQPIQKSRAELERNPEIVDKIIKEGADKARAVASQTVNEVKKAMGLL